MSLFSVRVLLLNRKVIPVEVLVLSYIPSIIGFWFRVNQPISER
ncbi:protein of unknown function [Candidatus Methylacidiphilum fumarolicum]|uniref:Uncharacterized protein n=1 Tax=Candidatus Methylacidiphilum fumarolicum TaxID=591154 RepID=A0ABN8XF30_9BACT|nr:protein of unknown function [Candidatus Methylacidiphilum fumarolicum]